MKSYYIPGKSTQGTVYFEKITDQHDCETVMQSMHLPPPTFSSLTNHAHHLSFHPHFSFSVEQLLPLMYTVCKCTETEHLQISDRILRELEGWVEIIQTKVVLGCIPQVYEACTCPASRLKKEPGVSDRDTHGLIAGGREAGSHIWSHVLQRHPWCAMDSGNIVAVLAPRGWGGGWVRGTWCQVGSLVTMETSWKACPSWLFW